MSDRALPRCEATEDYWGGCGAPARYRIERPGEGYSPENVCPAHLADAIAYLVDGDDVEVTVHVYFDEPGSPELDPVHKAAREFCEAHQATEYAWTERMDVAFDQLRIALSAHRIALGDHDVPGT